MDIINPTICEGCMSVDRNLTWVNEEIRMVFCDISGDTLSLLQLCWECVAIIKKFIKFKQQVTEARKTLSKYYVYNSTVSSLSNLKQSTYTSLSVSNLENDYNMTDNVLSCFHVKAESVCDNEEVFYNEDFLDQDQSHIENPILQDTDTVVPVNKVRKTRSKTIVDFNESDDEPLKPTVKNNSKTRGKKKEPKTNKKRSRKEERTGVITNARVLKKLEQLNVSADQIEMVMLSWEEVEMERQAALQSETFTRHEYRCYDCVLGFNYRCKLDAHMKKHDPGAGGVECGVCRVRCRDALALAAHKRRHRLRWRCRSCGASWSRASVAADHAARRHGAAPPAHTCRRCGHAARTLGKLRSHLKNHAERQKCELCGKTFRDKTSLRSHMFIHSGEKEFECPRCGKRFLFKKAMEIHLITHDSSALLYCYECDMNFKNSMSYNQHMKYNLKHIDPAKLKYACDACDKKFAKATRLEEHKLAVHLKLTPISCTVPGCDFACSSRPVLRTHIRMLHRNVRSHRNHVCHVCGKAYSSKMSLEGHLRSHSGERPLACGRCPAAFGYSAALYNHTRLVHRRAPQWRKSEDEKTAVPAADLT